MSRNYSKSELDSIEDAVRHEYYLAINDADESLANNVESLTDAVLRVFSAARNTYWMTTKARVSITETISHDEQTNEPCLEMSFNGMLEDLDSIDEFAASIPEPDPEVWNSRQAWAAIHNVASPAVLGDITAATAHEAAAKFAHGVRWVAKDESVTGDRPSERLLLHFRQSHGANVSGLTQTGHLSDSGQTDGVKDPRTPTQKRDDFFLKRDREMKAERISDRRAAIRDEWNAMSDEERQEIAPQEEWGKAGAAWQKISEGKNGSGTVRKGIERAEGREAARAEN